jgi:hypothetical protein
MLNRQGILGSGSDLGGSEESQRTQKPGRNWEVESYV